MGFFPSFSCNCYYLYFLNNCLQKDPYIIFLVVGRVFANGPGDLGSIPVRVIPKTFKMVLDTSLFNTQQYKVRIKGKVGQSREWSSTSPTPRYSSYWKGSLRVALDYGRQLYLLISVLRLTNSNICTKYVTSLAKRACVHVCARIYTREYLNSIYWRIICSCKIIINWNVLTGDPPLDSTF